MTSYEFIVTRHRWLMPVILATQEAEVRRITVQASLGKWFTKPYVKKPYHKKLAEWLKVKALSSNPSTVKKNVYSIGYIVSPKGGTPYLVL
jgi:hypothetical protein